MVGTYREAGVEGIARKARFMAESLHKLTTIIASTRPGRVGHGVAHWFHGVAEQVGVFENSVADLAELNLPLYDEPHHPNLQKYQHDHTKAWSKIVDGSDAFVIVTPEYNYGPPPSLVNALDFVYKEWNYKPVAFVSYGGASGGLRAVQMIKQIVTTLKLMPMMEAVTLPFVATNIVDGKFTAPEVAEKAARVMLAELLRWSVALKTMRA
jgi:NAD(P)H-dependent FMN reductase